MSRLMLLQQVALLWTYLLPPVVLSDNLRCYFSPVLEREYKFELIVTECPPDELCYKADGRYGNHSALSARGCMAVQDCGRVNTISIKGTVYTMIYTCCDTPYCNSAPGVTAQSSLITATLVTVAVMTSSL